ncbi:hypothetical protein [Blastococcus brunescens]|uniref:Uncharacterized protein n=1 Tax=Blastococcus brunescens TaxID=1564165 RepID=A0ABZ1AZK7_9ACTN|nr:hypothetical protein [Blastococcus sp. BMG 8361]WRL64005.1 hypothetical protein U6N30_31175 [Blastococcus sp. BMG 8361]
MYIGADTDVRTGECAVRRPLPGGWPTAWGAELHRVVAAAEALDPDAAARGTA